MNPEIFQFHYLLSSNIESYAKANNRLVPKKFLEQKDGAGKIRFCLNQMAKKNCLPAPSKVLQPKSDAVSVDSRTKGNEFFKSKDYVSALDWYNRSICFAPNNSENLGIGYANRSAVFLNSGFYKFCLQNIDLALANNYPEKLKGKLESRKKECLEKMKTREDSLVKFDKEYTPLQLSYPVNKRIPMMIEGLEYAESEQFGHLIRTKRDLKPGDIFIIENAFTTHVINDSEYKRCANCLEPNYLNLFPCDQCTKTMFCSENCQLEARNRFHKYECKIIDGIFFLNLMHIGTPVATPIRAFLQSITMFEEPQDLQSLIDSTKLFDLDFTNLTDELHFRAGYSLATNESKRQPHEIFDFAVECAIVWKLLKQYTDLSSLLKTKETEDLFLNIFFHFYQSSIINAQALGHAVEPEEYGTAIFPFSSLLNHSCIPNVSKIFGKGTVVMYAKRAIKAGEQLFDSYGQHLHHGHARLVDRQRKLRIQYHFECKCKACRFDYPLLKEMQQPRNKRFFETCLKDLKKTFSYDKEFAKKKVQEYKKHLIEFDKHPPTLELYGAEDVFTYTMWTLMFGRPLNMQLKSL